MTTNSHSKLSELENKVAQLSEENSRLKAELAHNSLDKGFYKTMANGFAKTWLGSDILKAGEELAKKSQEWSDGNDSVPPVREAIHFLTAGVFRFTRIGFFRIFVAMLITVVTLWFTGFQVSLLRNQNQLITIQNQLIESQKKIEAAGRYTLFSKLEKQARHSANTVFDFYYVLKDLPLKKSDSKISYEVLRKAVNSATPSKDTTIEIVNTCSIDKYPVGNPTVLGHEIIELMDQGKILGAQSKTAYLRRWFKDAGETCRKVANKNLTIQKKMQAEMSDSGASNNYW